MKKSLYLFSLVIALGIAGLVEAVSGYILWFALPSGEGRRGLESTYWALGRHTWIDLHDWAAIVLTVAVIVHLLIHWKWVVRMAKQIWGRMTDFRRDEKTQVIVRESLSLSNKLKL